MLNRSSINFKLHKFLHKINVCSLLFVGLLLLSACDTYVSPNDAGAVIADASDDASDDVSDTISDSENNTDINSDAMSDTVDDTTEDTHDGMSEKDMVSFNPDDSFSYCDQPECLYDMENDSINFSVSFNSVPKSDDLYLYLFEMSTYEKDTIPEGKNYIASEFKDHSVTLSIPYKTRYLFSRFVPAIKYDGKFYPLSLGQYMTNPEALAENTSTYPEIKSKKGLLLDPMTIDKDELNSLNVKRVVYNIPLSFIIGETDNEACPTVDFDYSGKTYHFNGFMLDGFDSLFSNLTANGYHVTAIILNDWNEKNPEIIHPMSRKKTSKSMYYCFNTEERDGVRLMEATSLFLARRYSGKEYGLINDWVIANEINQQKIWNYMATADIDYYTESFEKSFRTFYNAAKSSYSNANVYFSIDHDWNDNNGLDYLFFNGKDVIDKYNEIAKSRGNYDWGVSIHPYPSPLTHTKFWYGYRDKSADARLITPMNLTVLTDYMQKDELLDTKGNVRPIGITELGFSSKSGEKVQAAAFAYCYHIIYDNEYINSFLMNRQTDSYASLLSGLALGIYNPDYSSKYIADVFSNIDTDKGSDYIDEMLEIIGAESLEEALSWAK